MLEFLSLVTNQRGRRDPCSSQRSCCDPEFGPLLDKMGGKWEKVTWVLLFLSVRRKYGSSQPYPEADPPVVGKRSYRDTLHLLRDLSKRMNRQVTPVITTDGFKFYERVNGRVFVPGCLCGQAIKRAGTIAWSKSSEEP